MAPQALLVKVCMEVLNTENERLGKKGKSSSPLLQQSCHYQYVPQQPIVHLMVAPPKPTTDGNKVRSMLSSSVVVGS